MSHSPGPESVRPADALISVVVPVFNEVNALQALRDRVAAAVAEAGCRCEFVFVDDGSTDGSAAALDRMAASHPDVRVLHLSRNFGQQAAIQAGLAHAAGHAVVVMDADMQDDPCAVAEFIARWREGLDVVYAVRLRRKEGWLRRGLTSAFYRLLSMASKVRIPLDAGSFGLVDRRVAQEILRLPDHDRFYTGLRSWVGFRQTGISVERHARYDGRARVSLWGLVRLAKSAVISFSALPLTVFYVIALLCILAFVGVGGFALYHKLFTGLAIPGWASLTMLICFFGAMNALGISILGEYILRIYDQVRGRPSYIVDRKVNLPSHDGRPGSDG